MLNQNQEGLCVDKVSVSLSVISATNLFYVIKWSTKTWEPCETEAENKPAARTVPALTERFDFLSTVCGNKLNQKQAAELETAGF